MRLAGGLSRLPAACVNTARKPTASRRSNPPGFCEWPGEVRHFVEHRDLCGRVHGEVAHDDERRCFLQRQWQIHCEGSDAERARLKAEYQPDSRITRMPSEFENNIEWTTTATAAAPHPQHIGCKPQPRHLISHWADADA